MVSFKDLGIATTLNGDKKRLDENVGLLESKLASVKGVTNHACTHHFMDSLGYEELEEQIKRRKTECQTIN